MRDEFSRRKAVRPSQIDALTPVKPLNDISSKDFRRGDTKDRKVDVVEVKTSIQLKLAGLTAILREMPDDEEFLADLQSAQGLLDEAYGLLETKK